MENGLYEEQFRADRAKCLKLISSFLTGMKRYIVLIANIKDGKPVVKCFLFEIENGKQLPAEEGCFKELDGDSPFRLNSFVMKNVRNGAESLNDKDTRTKLPSTRHPDGTFVFNTSTNEGEKSPTSTSEEQQESKLVNNTSAESVHEGENNPETEEVSTGQSRSSNDRSDSQQTTTTNEEEKKSTSPSQEPQELKLNDQAAESVDEGKNDPGSEEAITDQPKSPDDHSDPQPTTTTDREEKSQTSGNDPPAESVHKGGSHPETKELSTGEPGSSNDRSHPQHTTTTNGEEKESTSQSEEHQDLKVNDQPAESVDEGKNDPGSEKTITDQPKSPDDHSDPQPTTTTNGEKKSQTSGNDPPTEARGGRFCGVCCC